MTIPIARISMPDQRKLRVEADRGGGNPGVTGAGSVREAGEERAGDGIPKGAGVGRNRK